MEDGQRPSACRKTGRYQCCLVCVDPRLSDSSERRTGMKSTRLPLPTNAPIPDPKTLQQTHHRRPPQCPLSEWRRRPISKNIGTSNVELLGTGCVVITWRYHRWRSSASQCIAMENELYSMMMRRPKTLDDYEISLSNKITKRAREMGNMKCSEFPTVVVALKAATKEANSICELLKNAGDDQRGQFIWSKTIRNGALRAMIKIFNECSAEDSAMGSIAEKSVFGESDDKNCSKNELVQNDNAKETNKINQETKVENSKKMEHAQNVDPIDAAHSLLQQISLQQKQSTKSLEVLVETLSNVKGSMKRSKGVIDHILSTVQRLESDYQLVTNQVVDAKNQLEELSNSIKNFQVQVYETKTEHKEEVKYLKNELGIGLKKLSSEVSEFLTAIQQVKQSHVQFETMILSKNKQLEESLLTKQQDWVQLMLTQLEERGIVKAANFRRCDQAVVESAQ